MEHLTTFGLSRDPFANDPQLSFWFESPGALDCSRRLARAAQQGKGLCVLTGEGGVGKTVLVRHFLESLEEEVFEAALLVPVPGVSDGPWILDRFARHLGVEEPATTPAELLGQIYEQLAIVREDGRHAVLILDEAQVLAEEGLLRNLRGLLNLEYEEKRLLTLVLVGLPALATAVADESALADRVDLRLRLDPMDAESAARYLRHRIGVAGGNPAILESAAVTALVKHAGGSPRRLNGLADAALFEAHLAGRVSATAEDVERAVAETGLEPAAGALAAAPAPGAAASAAGRPGPTEAEAAPPSAAAGRDEALFGSDPLDLDEVVADETDPQLRGGPDEPATWPDRPAPAGAPDETVAFLEEPPVAMAEPRPARAAAAETVAIFQDDTTGPGASDGELDDLFADIVED